MGSLEKTHQVLLQTLGIFVTHIHTDHSVGIMKILCERDTAIYRHFQKHGNIDEIEPLTVFYPYVCLDWLQENIELSGIKYTEMIKIAANFDVNPEKYNYYQYKEDWYWGSIEDKPRMSKRNLMKQPRELVDGKIESFEPENEIVADFYKKLKEKTSFEKLLGIENNHCNQSYSVLLSSKKHGKFVYTGDIRPDINVINYAQGAKLLIQEATLPKSQHHRAAHAKHCSVLDAIEMVE